MKNYKLHIHLLKRSPILLMEEIIRKYKHTIVCTVILFLLSFMGIFMVFLRYAYTERAEFLYLIWNLFLSWIPLVVSTIMAYIYSTGIKGKLIFILPLGVIWLLFYPNAPYMITDFIHFRDNYTLLIWYDLVIYTTFIFTSYLLGFVSIFHIKRIVAKMTNSFISWIFMIFVLFLSSYAIYIGRFIRLNSWDAIFNPAYIVNVFLNNINKFSIVFSLIYGSLLTLTYTFLYSRTYLKLEKID